jgi:hypothetical protein
MPETAALTQMYSVIGEFICVYIVAGTSSNKKPNTLQMPNQTPTNHIPHVSQYILFPNPDSLYTIPMMT